MPSELSTGIGYPKGVPFLGKTYFTLSQVLLGCVEITVNINQHSIESYQKNKDRFEFFLFYMCSFYSFLLIALRYYSK